PWPRTGDNAAGCARRRRGLGRSPATVSAPFRARSAGCVLYGASGLDPSASPPEQCPRHPSCDCGRACLSGRSPACGFARLAASGRDLVCRLLLEKKKKIVISVVLLMMDISIVLEHCMLVSV